ncbi:hypothetical protein LINGRAHAP2_LOCUS32342 [Linum grandiflorum]
MTLVLRLVGKKVDIQYLYNRLRVMWQPMGRFRMVDLESEVFLAIFEDSSDYFHALTGGPWTILDHYLAVFAWDLQFRVSDDLPQKMVVWIRFPRLPYQYYHSDVLTGLGDLIGKTVRFDSRTQSSVRGKFARIAVEIDLTNPPPKGVFVDGMWQVVEYENLPSFCRECGRFGHNLGSCARRLPTAVSDHVNYPPSSKSVLVGKSVASISPVEPDGPWQTVERRRRRSKKESSNQLVDSAKSEEIIKGRTDSYPSNGSNKSTSEIKGVAVGNINFHSKISKTRQTLMPKPVAESSNSGLSWRAKSGVPTGGFVTQITKINRSGPGNRPIMPKHAHKISIPSPLGPGPVSVMSAEPSVAAATLSSLPSSPSPTTVPPSHCSDDPEPIDVSMTDHNSGLLHMTSVTQKLQSPSPISSVLELQFPTSISTTSSLPDSSVLPAFQNPKQTRRGTQPRKALGLRSIRGKTTRREKSFSSTRMKSRNQVLVGSIPNPRCSLPTADIQGLQVPKSNIGLAVDSYANDISALASNEEWEDNIDDEAVDVVSTCSDVLVQQPETVLSNAV